MIPLQSEMEVCDSSGSHKFIRVKEEPAENPSPAGEARDPEESTYRDSCHWQGSYLKDKTSPVIESPSVEVQVKVEPVNEQHSDSLNKEECVKDDEMKEELSWSDGVDCGKSEAVILADLYRDHEVKDELVLGLECSHRPDVNLVVRGGTLGKGLKDCCVRLKRLPSHEALLADNEHKTNTQDTTDTDTDSDEMEIYSRGDCEKEPTCDLCGEYFALKSDLVKHVIEHIYVPSMNDESGQDVAGNAFAGQCKQDSAQERALCRKYALLDCYVRLERLHSDALLSGHQRRTAAGTTMRADTESDTEEEIYNVDCEKEPTCEICGLRFALNSDLKKHGIIHIHMATTHDQSPAATIHSDGFSDNEEEIDISVDCEKEPICKFCGAKFALYSNLQKHVMIYGFGTCTKRPPSTGESNIYVCDTCGTAFRQKYCLKRHIQNNHLPTIQKLYSSDTSGNCLIMNNAPKKHLRFDTTGKLYSCNICRKQFTAPSLLKRHTLIHTGAKPYSCKVCNKSLRYKHNLEIHMRIHTGEKPYPCTMCSKRFTWSSDLKSHQFIHTGEQPYSCTICSKRFTQSGDLKRHRLIHTGEQPYSCTICSKRFTYMGDLKKHQLKHTGERPYSCTVCSKRFTLAHHLKSHQLIHTGERPYSCTICSKRFTLAHHLKSHRLIHTGEQPYSCTICSKRFTLAHSLKSHRLIHTGEKPYSCTICSKRFTQARLLKSHRLEHTGEQPYSCTICSKRFTLAHYLKSHQLIHTGEKPYACTMCSKRFKRSADLKRHRLIHNRPEETGLFGEKSSTSLLYT